MNRTGVVASPSRATVVVDARMVGKVPHGIARFVTDIASAYSLPTATEFRSRVELIFLLGPKADQPVLGQAPWSQVRIVECSSAFLSLKEWWELPGVLRRLQADGFYSPSLMALPYCPVPSAITLHDLNHLFFGGWFHRFYYRWILKPFLRRSTVSTVSESMRRDIAQWSGLNPASIQVIPNAIDLPVASESRVECIQKNTHPYFFCLSSPKAHKNIRFLLEAYAQYRVERQQVGVVPWDLVLSFELSKLGVVPLEWQEGVRGLPFQGDEALYTWVKGSGAVVFPSLYEGFGRPPLEALLCRVPVVVSNIPVHQEILQAIDGKGGSAMGVVFFDPKKVGECASALKTAENGVMRDDRQWKVPESTVEAIRQRYSVVSLGRKVDHLIQSMLEMRQR